MGKLTKKQIETAVERASGALAEYCILHNRQVLVTGVSGGLDSAVTIALANRACKKAVAKGFNLQSVGLILPCGSKQDAETLAREVIEKFGTTELKIDLTEVYDFIEKSLLIGLDGEMSKIIDRDDWSVKVARGNVRARLRMTLGTYHVARMLGGMVLSTDNLSEYWMGFWTICGDVGDYGMIQNVLKGLELYDIAEYLGVPESILSAMPDDGLGIAGGDEDQLGADYKTLDMVMLALIRNGFDVNGDMDQLNSLPKVEGVSPDVVLGLAKRSLTTAFKRKGTINLTREELGLPKLD